MNYDPTPIVVDESLYNAYRLIDAVEYKHKHYHISHVRGPEQPLSLIAHKLDERASRFGYRYCHCAPPGYIGIRIHTD